VTAAPERSDGERLQKALAHAGVGSRRSVEELIKAGRVKVDGRPAILGQRVDPASSKVEVDGSIVPLGPGLVYYLLNKPVGVVTSADDERGRSGVLDIVDLDVRVWPAGRLDMDSEGALVLTNDGELTLRLTHPRYGIEKTYLAEVRGSPSRAALKRLERGVELDDGPARALAARIVARRDRTSLVEVVMAEGRKREVRRMLDAIGHEAVALARTAIGPVGLGRLKPGSFRKLSSEEVRALYRASAGDEGTD
jgi:23S rRNA pseudouridine2605 synthase